MNDKYFFSVKKAYVKKPNGNDEELATIVVVDKSDGFFIPHPVTDFIKIMYASDCNYNTQKTAAETIKKFLNWLIIDNFNIYKLKSFEHLQIKHGVDYLNYLKDVKGLSRNSIKSADRYLVNFYQFLSKRKILELDILDDINFNIVNNKKTYKSPFIGNGVTLPTRKFKEEKITMFPDKKLITLFIDVALEVAPEIALGIYMQMFGGLRRGEIVNLTLSDLKMKGPYASEGLIVEIKDRPYLFSHLRDTSKEQVKNPRVQPIQFTNYLPHLCKEMMDRYQLSMSKNEANAIFLDNNHKPMSGAVYEKRFSKVKKAFLKELEKMNSPHFYYLKRHSWGTHIGRGIYTNLMASIVKSPSELAILRGDKSLTASLEYMSMRQVKNEVQDGLNEMFENGEFNSKELYDNERIDISERITDSLKGEFTHE